MNPTTANSTPSGLPAFEQPKFGSNNFNLNTLPLMQSNLAPSVGVTPQTPAPAPMTQATEQYSPQMGPSTQRVADASYTSAITDAVSNSNKVPSSMVTSGSNFAGAGATRNSYEAMLQQYLDQQKDFQKQLLSANTAGPAETAAAQRLAQLRTQAGLNQEQALNSGETSSFAGGEAQRVARTDAIKLAGAAAELQQMQNYREGAVKTIEALMASGDRSFKTQLEIQKLQDSVSSVDKQAESTLYNYLGKPEFAGIDFTPDPTKSAVDNLNDFRKLVAKSTAPVNGEFQATIDIASGFESGFGAGKNAKAILQNLAASGDYQSLLTSLKSQARKGMSSALAQEVLKADAGVSSINRMSQAIQEYQRLGGKMGFLKGKEDSIAAYFGKLATDPKFNEIGTELTAAFQQYRQDMTGAAFGAAENAEYQSVVPMKGKSIELNLSVMNGLKNYLTNKADDTYNEVLGVGYRNVKGLARDQEAASEGWSQEEINAFKQKMGFSSVGSDTNQATEQNLMGGFANMQGLMGQIEPVDMGSTAFGGMSGLMKATPVLQKMKVQIPQSSALSFANNNPGNLRFANQTGAVQGKGGFARFNSPEEGLNALMNQIKLDAGRGHTLSTFINKFAPPTENNTKLYIQQAMKALGVSKDTPISQIPLDKLTQFVALKESSTKIN